MKCSKCKKLLVEFTDGRLEHKLHQEIMTHISGCEICRQELDNYQQSLRLLDDIKNSEIIPDAPDGFAEKVMEQMQQKSGNFFGLRKFTIGIALVTCLLVMGLVLYPEIWQNQNSYIAIETIIDNSTNSVEAIPLDQARVKMVKLLDQTLEIIERGEQKWEIEI